VIIRSSSHAIRTVQSDSDGKQVIDSRVHKVTRAQVGGVAEPGRYLFTFGWLTITEADLAVWERFPDAAFTLVAQPGTEPVEEYRLGAFVP
jgi:hypothetical protein